ncbi:putative alanine racemase-domain-containing protein [Crepidotus variabilis]|uniref:Alanine racemase-domain-containing protein n=1 Tax=Crepidotus variabilis TaxID=179855 RepID=A0A9P6EPN3_9AGAR|nr:putative alanine racemase-domain-containing protein [Crepidotus variabilis]
MPLIQTTSAAEEIRRLFQENQNIEKDKFPGLVTQHFQNKYASEDAFSQIPVLGLDNVPESFEDGALVVFYGMIQDTSLSSELYIAKGSSDEIGGWGLPDLQDNSNFQPDDLLECSVFWVVSIPGLSSWSTRRSSISKPDTQSPLPYKYPATNVAHVGVQLKVYDESLASPLRATDVHAFVGILNSESFHFNQDSEDVPSVPTLHVLFKNPLQRTIIPRSFPEASLKSSIQTVRKDLIQWIACEALDGDVIVAELILLTLLTKVQSRKPPILPLSLTISGFPPPANISAIPTLQHVLGLIFPMVSTIQLSLDTLNTTPFCPESKDEDLHSGWLQLPVGSIVILNEGAVTEGTVSNRGVSNIRVVQEAMQSQTLEYVFPFSNYRFETDINFVVLTESKNSTFFETNFNVPFDQKNTAAEVREILYKSADQISLPPDAKLDSFRRLVGAACVGKVAVGEDIGKYVEQDFITERAAGQFTADDLVRRMSIAKMVALSFHDTELSIVHWKHIKELERKIKEKQHLL